MELHVPNIPKDSVQGKDIERFRWFSSDYLSPHPELKNVLVDMRYSLIPNQVNPLWGIEVDPAQIDTHVQRKTFRSMSVQNRLEFFKMLFDQEK
jgi:inner membrane protein